MRKVSLFLQSVENKVRPEEAWTSLINSTMVLHSPQIFFLTMPPSYFATFCWSATWLCQAWQVCHQHTQSNVLDELGQDCGLCPAFHYSATDMLQLVALQSVAYCLWCVYLHLSPYFIKCAVRLRGMYCTFHCTFALNIWCNAAMGDEQLTVKFSQGEMAEEEKMNKQWKG